MKLNAIMCAGFVLMLMCSPSSASTSTFPAEMDCKQYKSLYYQYLLAKAYPDARNFWLKAYSTCEGSSELNSNFFHNGVFIYEKLAEVTFEHDSAHRQQVLDSTRWVYEEYLKVDQSASVKLNYAVFLMQQNDTNVEKMTNLFYSVDSLKELCSANELYYAFKHFVFNIYPNAPESAKLGLNTTLFNTYFKLTNYANLAIKNAQINLSKEAAAKPIKDFTKTKQLLTAQLLNEVKDCAIVEENMKAQLVFLPSDSAWRMDALTEGLMLMRQFNCINSQVYLSYIYASLAIEPNPETWVNLAQMEMSRGAVDKAIENYQKALTLAPNDSLNALIMYQLVVAWYDRGMHQKAFETAKKVQGEYRGKALLLCGNVVAKTASTCGESTFAREANFWLANDYYLKAIELGEKASSTEFLARAPNATACFAEGLSAGDFYTLSCWNEKTRVRF